MILYDEPAVVYHARPEVSNSQLSDLARSPYHFWAAHVAKIVERPDTPAMAFGRLVHALILEPHIVDRLYYVDAENTRADARTKKYQAVLEAASGREVVKQQDYDRARRIRDAVAAHPAVREILRESDADGVYNECTVIWTDEETAIDCRGRIDRLDTELGLLIDVKTTRDASPGLWQKSVWNYGYDRQAAMYADGLLKNDLQAAGSWPMVWICVEQEPPHAVAVYGCGDGWYEVGRARYMALLRKLRECRDRDHWPAYHDGLEILEPPAWAIDQVAHSIGFAPEP